MFLLAPPSCTLVELPKVDKVQDVIRGHDVDTDPSAYETEPSDLRVGISIQNLTKIYDTVREYHHLVCNVSLPAVFLHFTIIGLISWLHCLCLVALQIFQWARIWSM